MCDPEPIVLDYLHPQHRAGRRRSFGEELFKLAVLATLFITYGFSNDTDKPLDLFLYAGLALWLGIAAAYIRRRRDRSTLDVSDGWRRALWCLLVVCLLVPNLYFVVPYHCVHGYRWANRWVAFAWSQNGGPCGDGPHAWGTHPRRITQYWYVYIPRD